MGVNRSRIDNGDDDDDDRYDPRHIYYDESGNLRYGELITFVSVSLIDLTEYNLFFKFLNKERISMK